MTKRLKDGRRLVIRPIRADDKPMLERGLRNLSDRSVQRRFLSPKRTFSRAELRYLTEVDAHDHVALVAEFFFGPVRRIIGVARFVRLAEDPEAAEAAIVVGDPWQGQGVGSALARELGARARGLGVKRFTATMASDNKPALRLMETLTEHLESDRPHHGVSELVLDLAA
jgi:RimJ/RimL family protein N-acetyltransferase